MMSLAAEAPQGPVGIDAPSGAAAGRTLLVGHRDVGEVTLGPEPAEGQVPDAGRHGRGQIEHVDGPASPHFAVDQIAAASFGLIAVANAFSHGPTLQQREIAQQIFRQHGISIPLPPAAGFNWPGTITPAIISLLFVVLIIVVRATRAKRT